MAVKLKKLSDQVMVITGASSGIGLATAETAANEGAKLVLAARSGEALDKIVGRIKAAGGEALAVTCDVADRAQVERVAEVALARFGRIDTWVNDAGIAIYGRLDEVSEEDSRKLFDTNFWGLVNGSLSALPHLKRDGGALINVGSEFSEAAVPLLGMYTASKHAVKGFTDALRLEIEEVDKAPVSITLIQPTAVDTPFPQHGRNYQDKEPKLPDPMIEPQKVADAILEAAVTPMRSKKVGAMAVLNTAMAKLLPGLGDKMAAKQVDCQHYEEPPRHPEGALHQPSETTGVVGQTQAPAAGSKGGGLTERQRIGTGRYRHGEGAEHSAAPGAAPARPGVESEMTPSPEAEDRHYKASGKLDEKIALITGGDSGIGRAVAILFAKEGADIAVSYLNEHGDAEETKRRVEQEGRRCILIPGDVGDESYCRRAVRAAIDQSGALHILVNNAAEQHPQESIDAITAEQLVRTFRTNIFGMFFMVKAALPHLQKGALIVNTTSVTAYQGNPTLLDYSSTKGAIVAFTRSLSLSLIEQGIRVNAVAPGPIWTPLIPSTFPAEKVEKFGSDVPMKRPGQPHEVAKCFLFLTSEDSSYLSGQVLHPNGGKAVNG